MGIRRVYHHTGNYDLDLSSSGHGWLGSYRAVVVVAVNDILTEGSFGPVEITTDDGRVTTGVLLSVNDEHLVLDHLTDADIQWEIPVESILRLRA